DDDRQQFTNPRPGHERGHQGEADQKIDRRVLEKIDRVREERHRSNGPRHPELHAEIGEVQDGDDQDDITKAWLNRRCDQGSIQPWSRAASLTTGQAFSGSSIRPYRLIINCIRKALSRNSSAVSTAWS